MKLRKQEPFFIRVDPAGHGLRLDKWLSLQPFVSSRARASELIARGLVTYKDRPVKASLKLTEAMEIKVELPIEEPATLQPLAAPLDIMFEDEDLVVVNKPAGLVVHPSAGHEQDTLVNILLYHIEKLSMGFGERRPGIVHRLDRDTSGVLVVAKNDRAHQHLSDQFRRKSLHRIYWAIAAGAPKSNRQTFRSYLARHPHDRKRFASAAKGKLAVTHCELIELLRNKFSWLRLKLETGRTHQIRVHLSEAGLPILGDPVYGGRAAHKYVQAPRMALHATELGFVHPSTGRNMMFKADWPEELAGFVKALGFTSVSS